MIKDIEGICSLTCDNIKKAESDRLKTLYEIRPFDKLKEIEHTSLIKYAIELPLSAQETIKKVFSENEITHFNLAWRDVANALPSISYVYIVWDKSDDSEPQEREHSSYLKLGSILGTKLMKRDSQSNRNENADIDYHESFGFHSRDGHSAVLRRDYDPVYYEKAIWQASRENLKRLEDWCKKLNELMVIVMRKYGDER